MKNYVYPVVCRPNHMDEKTMKILKVFRNEVDANEYVEILKKHQDLFLPEILGSDKDISSPTYYIDEYRLY